MKSSTASRVLVVAQRTAASDTLAAAVRARAAEGPAHFTLLIPRPAPGEWRTGDPDDEGRTAAAAILAHTLPAFVEAAGSPVEGIIGDSDPLIAIEDEIAVRQYDEILISTRPARLSHWLKLRLPDKVAELGLLVRTATPHNPRAADALERASDHPNPAAAFS